MKYLKQLGVAACVVCTTLNAQAATQSKTKPAAPFSVSTQSTVKGHFTQAQFANVMGCTGENLSPQISWKNAPEGTKSFVVTVYDRDAPTGSGWWHWVVANIPANVSGLPAGASSAGSLPKDAISIKGDSGQAGYSGICPPVGQAHRYVITVHALKVDKLDLPPFATPAMVGFMSYANSLGKASTTIRGKR